MSNLEQCVVCSIGLAIDGFNYCSKECVLIERLCNRLKRIEDMLVEIKHQIKEVKY